MLSEIFGRLPDVRDDSLAHFKMASTRFPKFVIRLRVLAYELRKAKGTSKPVILVPLCDLKFRLEFAARDAGTSNRRHQGATHR
jgi:hypothetical protein